MNLCDKCPTPLYCERTDRCQFPGSAPSPAGPDALAEPKYPFEVAQLRQKMREIFREYGVGDGTPGWIEHTDQDGKLKRDTLSFEGELIFGIEAILERSRPADSGDAERLDWFEQEAKRGGCPALVNDDNGRWAVSESGMQNVPDPSGPTDIATTFFVAAADWKPTVREAIDAALRQDKEKGE